MQNGMFERLLAYMKRKRPEAMSKGAATKTQKPLLDMNIKMTVTYTEGVKIYNRQRS